MSEDIEAIRQRNEAIGQFIDQQREAFKNSDWWREDTPPIQMRADIDRLLAIIADMDAEHEAFRLRIAYLNPLTEFREDGPRYYCKHRLEAKQPCAECFPPPWNPEIAK